MSPSNIYLTESSRFKKYLEEHLPSHYWVGDTLDGRPLVKPSVVICSPDHWKKVRTTLPAAGASHQPPPLWLALVSPTGRVGQRDARKMKAAASFSSKGSYL